MMNASAPEADNKAVELEKENSMPSQEEKKKQKKLSLEEVLDDTRASLHTMKNLSDYHNDIMLNCIRDIGKHYWDYIQWRSQTAELLLKEDYAGLVVKVLKSNNAYRIFKNDSVWFPTYYTYNTTWNYSDTSVALAKDLAEKGLLTILLANLHHKPYLDNMQSKNVVYVLKSSLSIVHNISKAHEVHHVYRELNAIEVLKPYLEKDFSPFMKGVAMLCVANLVNEDENAMLADSAGIVPLLVKWMDLAVNNSKKRRHQGFTPVELAEGLARLASHDSNKAQIMKAGVLKPLINMMNHTDVEEQRAAARVVWNLAFDESARKEFAESKECMNALYALEKSDHSGVQKAAKGALWVINKESEKVKDTHSQQKVDNLIFISYSWDKKEIVLKIRDRLKQAGHQVWIDVEQMEGSTLQAMAEGIEKSTIMLSCMSEKYKESPNCRTEAEYCFQLRKVMIPLMMERYYRPDGWLGIILGSKLFYDFSGKYEFEVKMRELLAAIEKNLNQVKDVPVEKAVHIEQERKPPPPPSSVRRGLEEWSKEKVASWLKENSLANIMDRFKDYDGVLLKQLLEMRREAPEFFYQCLDRKLDLNMIEILKLTSALDHLNV